MRDKYQYTTLVLIFGEGRIVKKAIRDGNIIFENKSLTEMLNYIDTLKQSNWRSASTIEDSQIITYEFKRLR